MLDVCSDARYVAKVSPQIYNAWGIRYRTGHYQEQDTINEVVVSTFWSLIL